MLCPFNSATFLPLHAARVVSASSQLIQSLDSKRSPLSAAHGNQHVQSKPFIVNAEFPLFLEQGSVENGNKQSDSSEDAVVLFTDSSSSATAAMSSANQIEGASYLLVAVSPSPHQNSALSVEFWTPFSLSWIASAVGKPIQLDSNTAKMKPTKFAHVCVEVGAGTALPTKIRPIIGMNSETGLESPVEVNVDQQWKPIRCSKCQQIGHSVSQCKPKRIYWPTGRILPNSRFHSAQPV